LLRKAIETSSRFEAPYLTLAEIEERQGNIGDESTEYSAKWLLKKASEIPKDQDPNPENMIS
jgi:hypothetical protein